MERAKLGIDGNCGFALLGENIQEGESEFVEIIDEPGRSDCENKIVAAKRAFAKLQSRLNRPELSYYFDVSHPYGR